MATIEKGKAFIANEAIDYAEGGIVSKEFIHTEGGSVTLFSFDKGQQLSEHSAPFDAVLQIIDGRMEITVSGALPELMREIPDTPIYCTKKGEAIIRGHYHQDWNFVNVKTSDTLSLGDTTLTFIEATMLHWPDTKVVIKNIAHDDKNDAITEVFRSRAVLVGSPTINNGHSFAIAGLLEMMSGLKFKRKRAAAFGSYGWGGGSVKQISTKLAEAGFELVNDGIGKL